MAIHHFNCQLPCASLASSQKYQLIAAGCGAARKTITRPFSLIFSFSSSKLLFNSLLFARGINIPRSIYCFHSAFASYWLKSCIAFLYFLNVFVTSMIFPYITNIFAILDARILAFEDKVFSNFVWEVFHFQTGNYHHMLSKNFSNLNWKLK